MKPSTAPSSARELAARVLVRVADDRAFLAAALDAELGRARLAGRDRALATELAYGVTRTAPWLRARLLELAPRGLPDDALVTAHLLVAAYQLLCLDRIPAHAAVDEAVGALKLARGPGVAGFANAVLRRLAALPGEPAERRAAAVRASAPPWLWERLVRDVGEGSALALLGVDGRHEIGLRVRHGAPPPPWLESARPGRVVPGAWWLGGAGDPRRHPDHAAGAWVVQEEGAQAVALALGARPGERVLDACAGRGQKAAILAEQVGPTGQVVAVDLHPHKLRQLAAEFARLGLPGAEAHAVDWAAGTGELAGGFDRVLVDAPCTGTGTLRRRPEILARLQPGDPARMAALSSCIVRSAAALLRPGGHLVFAVCSVLREEGEGVCERLGDLLEPAPFPGGLPVLQGRDTLRLLPDQHGTDGYFLASFVRCGAPPR